MSLLRWIPRARKAEGLESFTVARRAVGLQAVPGILIILAAAYMINSTYLKSIALDQSIRGTISELSVQAEHISVDGDLHQIVTILDQARDLKGTQSGGLKLPLLSTTVDQRTLDNNYQQLTYDLLRPHLLQRLEQQMNQNISNFGYLYQSLMVYLMLGQAVPMQPDAVALWMQRDWRESLAGAQNRETRDSLLTHLEVILQNSRFSDYPLNGALIDNARRQILSLPPAERLYLTILSDAEATAQPQWRISDAAGVHAGRLFVRQSGLPLSAPTNGIFTRQAFEDYFLPSLVNLSAKTHEQDQILGLSQFTGQTTEYTQSLILDVIALYESDYIENWNALLADISIAPIETLDDALEVNGLISALASPMQQLLTSVARETDLATITTAIPAEVRQQMPGAKVTQYFAQLHDFVGTDEGDNLPESPTTPLDELTSAFDVVHNVTAALAVSAGNRMQFRSDLETVFARLQTNTLPFMSKWIEQIKDATLRATQTALREELSRKWRNEGLDICQQITSGRFPFFPESNTDITIQDFSALFGPGGHFDRFFRRELSQYVDRSEPEWIWEGLAQNLGFSQKTLRQFQHAAQIRDGFFAGSFAPRVNFRVLPISKSPNVARVRMNFGESEAASTLQQILPLHVRGSWPAPNPQAGIYFKDAEGATIADFETSGTWAIQRLFQTAEIDKNPDLSREKREQDGTIVHARFRIEQHSAVIEVQFATNKDTFFGDFFTDFQCPTGF